MFAGLLASETKRWSETEGSQFRNFALDFFDSCRMIPTPMIHRPTGGLFRHARAVGESVGGDTES